MKEMKRILSLVLCFVMLVGMMPAIALNADAAETVIDAAIFCSDVHGSSSDLTSVLGGVAKSGVDYSAIGFVGDTSLTVANTTSIVQSALSDTNIAVMFSYASSHDTESGADIDDDWDYSGEVEGVSNNYLVYTIRETDMQNASGASTAAPAFTTWYNGLTDAQKALPIFIMSHRPLHDRRDDNAGAATWYSVISAAAETSDIVFFWAHNHTEESSVDTAAYYVEKNGTESITVYNGDTVVPNFTYMNAGYINANGQNPARKGIATTVQITASSLIFQDYNSSGEYTGTYAHNVTVARTANSGSTQTTTLNSIAVTTAPTTTVYNVGDTFSADGLVVTATYSNGNTAAVTGYTLSEVDMTTAGIKTVTVTYTEGEVTKTATFNITVNAVVAEDAVLSSIAVSGKNEYSVGEALNLTVIATFEDGTTSTVTDYEVTGYDANTVGEQTVTVSYTYGDVTKTAEYTVTVVEADSNEVTLSGTVTTTKTKTVYVLSSGNPSGNVLIADSATAGDVHLVANDGGDLSNITTTVIYGDCDGDGDKEYYIELTDTEETNSLWAVSGSYTFENQDEYLRYNNGLSVSGSSTTWSYSDNRLSYYSNRNTNYLRYNSGWTTTNRSNSASSIYFYVPTEVEYEETVSTEVKYTMRASDMKQIVDATNTATLAGDLDFCLQGNGADLTTLPTGGSYSVTVLNDTADIIKDDAITADGTFTFTGAIGTATVKVAYTWTADDGNTYTVYKNITVEATAPYYTINLYKAELSEATGVTADNFASGTYYIFNETTNTYYVATEYVEGTTYFTTPVIRGDEIIDPIALKGIEAGDVYGVWAVVTKHTADGEEELGTLGDALSWTVSNTDVATIDTTTGVITFTGKVYGTIRVTVSYKGEDGETITDSVTISVEDSLYIVPGDGTDDFPEYPDQGAVRFDKTAVAQGNFSESGIAQVELSMTGVPYSTGSAIDVLLMIDMSTSMDATVGTDSDGNSVDRVDVTIAAAKAFAKTIVQNDDGTYTKNKIAIKYFNGSSVYTTTNYITVSNDSELEALYDLIEALYTPTSSGTYYSVAMENAYNTVTAQDTVSDNTQALVFMSDGGPTYYTYLNDSGTGTTAGGDQGKTFVSWFDIDDNDTTDETDDTATPNSSFKTEYYSHLLKKAGYPVYTVGLGLSSNGTGPSSYTALTSGAHESLTSYILSQMATSSSYFYNVADSDAVANLGNIFSAIAASIKEAATDVVVEDKIDSRYTMNFKLPSGVTSEEADMSEFYIQVVDYVLDSTTHERTGVYNVLENFTFNSDGSLKSHTVDGAACGDTCSHVTITSGTVTAIDGTYFDYTIDAKGDEFLTWNAEKLSSTELALEYFVYLDNSAGVTDASKQVDAGTYPTNEYATLTYTNYNGNRVQQEFPIPTMTWMGAQVTYVFYLVNSAGQPVNRAGRVVPFAEAVYVTTPVTYDVHWNEETGSENILAHDIFASSGVPEVYKLYDESAEYVIRVYQTESVDTNSKNGNYFQISGATDKLIDSDMDTDTTVDNSTTKVFNTKAGVKYDEYGVYSVYNAGTVLNTTDEYGNATTVTTTAKVSDIDYANTTVAFAVVWTPELVEDTVIVDYGLDVVIDVATNDALAAGVVGVRADKPDGTINSGIITAAKAQSVDLYIDANNDNAGLKELKIGTATVENLTSIRFSLDKTNGMQFTDSVVFYYESEVNYYKNGKLETDCMYSSVTVIPATTIYYEDSFIQFASFTNTEMKDEEGNVLKDDDGNVIKEFIQDEEHGWTTDGVVQNGEQDQDRPGKSKISADLDADNNYGYDTAYESMSTYSMGSAAMFNVTADTRGEAYFTFYGTGFDVIGMTSNTTGTLLVQVTDAEGNTVENRIVDTYYGYTRNEDGEWIVDNEVDNALYQVPVMKVVDLPYGKYSVKIMAVYGDFFNHTANAGNYTLYLDAIRIYDPTGNQDSTANNAYLQDGEGYPEYFEVRNQIIDKNTFDNLDDAYISGIVFIDGKVQAPTIEDYTAYGPNNEVYLSKDEAIAFDLNAAVTVQAGELKKIQLAVKTVGGTGKLEVYGIKNGVRTDCLNVTVSTATDMYYDITALEGMTVVIRSTGDAIISITNVKVTYTAAQPTTAAVAEVTDVQAPMMFSIRRSSAEAAVASMTEQEEIPETTVPETTVPETTVPETTVPETTEPEVTEPEVTEPETTVPETKPTLPETEPTEPETEPTEPSVEEQVEEIIKVIEKIIKGILGRLFG